jgi:hypothetical protein
MIINPWRSSLDHTIFVNVKTIPDSSPDNAITGPFDGFHATQASVWKTCLVRFDNNKYSVASRAVGRPVEIQAYADRIVIRQEGARPCEDNPMARERGREYADEMMGLRASRSTR